MIILKENNITAFDVDGTLVIWPSNYKIPAKDRVEFYYGDEVVYLEIHEAHVTFLKHCKVRGDYVSVWSQNGWTWAEQVILVLGLKGYVDEIRSKPSRHIDDKTKLEDIVGNRIFLNKDIEESK